MVRRFTEAGTPYHEPPYTEEECQDMERRWARGPVAFTRPGAAPPPAATTQPQPVERTPIVAHRHGLPALAVRRGHGTRVQGLGDGPQHSLQARDWRCEGTTRCRCGAFGRDHQRHSTVAAADIGAATGPRKSSGEGGPKVAIPPGEACLEVARRAVLGNLFWGFRRRL
jgi:hypothetical protein